VHNRGWPLFGDSRRQCIVHLVEQRQVTGLLRVELPVPPLQLASDIPLVLGEVGKTNCIEINCVNCRHRVNERLARRAPRSFGQHALGNLGITHHMTVNEPHHIERRTIHRRVGAHRKGWCNGHVGVAQRMDDAMFAPHIVRARQGVRQRRAAQHVVHTLGVGQLEREVRVTTSNHL